MSAAQIRSTILQHLQDAPDHKVTGAPLGSHIQKKLGRPPKDLGVPKLRDFVQSQLSDFVDVSQDGLIVTYRLKPGVVVPETNLADDVAPPPTSTQDLFRVWRSPTAHLRLVVREDGEVRAIDREALEEGGEFALETPTVEAHLVMARTFIDDVMPTEWRDEFRAKISATDPQWWRDWDRLFEEYKLPALRTDWLKYRHDRLASLLKDRVRDLSLPEAAKARAISAVLNFRLPPRAAPSAGRADDALRSALIAVIEQLPPSDLRQVWVPAGAFFDVLARRS